MRISNLKILHRLSGGFILVLLMTLIVGIVSMLKMETLADLTVKMYHHPLTVSNAVRDIRADILAMSRLMKDVILSGDSENTESAMTAMNEYEKAVVRNFDIVSERFLGDQSDVKAAYKAFSEWKSIRDEEFRLMRLGQVEMAKEMSIRKASQYLNETDQAIRVMTDFASNKADGFFENARQIKKQTTVTMIVLITAIFFTGTAAALVITQSITKPISRLIPLASDIAKGVPVEKQPVERLDEIGVLIRSFNEIIDSSNKTIAQARAVSLGDYSAELEPRSDKDELGIALQKMTQSLSRASAESERQNWIKTGQNDLNEKSRGNQDVSSLARNVIVYLSRYLNAQIGALYVMNEDNKLQLTGSYAFTKRKGFSHVIEPGEGLAGQAAAEKEIISVTEIPQDYIRISSAFGNAVPKNIVVAPLVYEDKIKGVIELGAFKEFSDTELNFLRIITENIAVALNSAQSRAKMEVLLDQTRKQAEELQIRQEELKAANEELLEQTQALKRSEEELRQQQEELETINEELEEKTRSLEEQRTEIRRRNQELENAREHIEQKAKELEITSKYKSEFLANMSHELRTPLNSILILSRNLADNAAGNLTDDQAECADIIYKSGNDLLELINEILDLSKIEAGKMNLHKETVSLRSVADNISLSFKHLIEAKGLRLEIKRDDAVPVSVETDRQRLEQILRNFMSNAVKFTEQGGITLSFHYPEAGTDLSRSGLDPQQAVAVSVSDTGIGIPKEKQLEIFEAFHQADGSTARKYGGTGLGLSISREIAKLLGGEIQISSEPGKGSVFTFFLPLKTEDGKTEAGSSESESRRLEIQDSEPDCSGIRVPVPSFEFADDRENLGEADKTILIIEDDPYFAKILLNQCHEKGFKGLVSASGKAGLGIAKQYRPEAIILDIKLPDINGLSVLEALKEDPEIRHIPVHIMSVEESSLDAFRKGAVGFLNKPARKEEIEAAFHKLEEVIEKHIKDLLIVEDDAAMRKAIQQLIGNGDVRTAEADSGNAAIAELKRKKFDCMVLDLGLPDMTGFELLSQLEKETDIRIPPVIVYTGKELTQEEARQLHDYADSIIVKGVKSEERLLDETALFLHRIVSHMPPKKQKMIISLHDKDSVFNDKKILLTDDDMRNVFALSKILKEKGLTVLKAEDGENALRILDKEPDVDLVLMDIMMPVMDGYETIRRIRSQPKFADLPIIALTAKAMKEDKEKCIAAGASDYLSKPVDAQRLFSMMRVWLYR